jgi:hypothetical protein
MSENDIDDPEPERYYEWQMWKLRQDNKMKKENLDNQRQIGKNDRIVLKSNIWDNHEDSSEETIRREMLAADERLDLFKKDMTFLTESYYKCLNRTKELVDENNKLKKKLKDANI